ncbi:hypothetical protein [Hymenobacter sp. BT190]|uniref:hypothetical protein n=1 Tax=Hymenobacter sp. BT190 TaxID=2763505 RepID=UPI00165189BB|nr:hypothetical protein [Hymenobacter sp. BT190]MBC6696641.1 hypothetical protein [Hymenobacter sp. BT190]
MKGYSLVTLLSAVFLLGNCQSQQAFLFRPTAKMYSSVTADVREPLVPTPKPNAAPAPELTAALPKQPAWDKTRNGYEQPSPRLLPPAPQVLTPDTAVKAAASPISYSKPDPATTVVNSIGGAITAVGLGVAIANSGEAPQTEWGGLGQAIGILGGLILALLGLGLLFFQGKNGRLRRLRESRKAALLPAPDQSPNLAPESASPNNRASQKQKTGFRLMIAGGVLGLLGLLVSGYFLFLLPVAVIVLLVGAVMSIIGV